jgi:hypothetical protein
MACEFPSRSERSGVGDNSQNLNGPSRRSSRARLPRKRRMRRRAVPLFLQCAQRGARPLGGDLLRPAARTLGRIALSLFARAIRCSPALRGRQLHPRAARLRKSNGDRLFSRTGAVLPLPDVFYLLAHKLPGLRARSLSFTRVLPRSLDGCFFRHSARLKGNRVASVEIRSLPQWRGAMPCDVSFS